ncbi:MAG: DUF5681 domain-containing protein [Pseudomonadota bacterium]
MTDERETTRGHHDRDEAAISDGRDERGRFAKGNPGRPPGTRTKATRAVEALLDGEAEALTRTAIEAALGGDVTALRLCLERIAPVRKDSPVAVALPEMKTAGDASEAMGQVVNQVADGSLTPTEGAAVASLIETFRRTLETTDLEARLAALEERQSK